jgi:hypothetical protein
MNDWVTIAKFAYPHEAALLKGRLESDGILSNIKDEHTIAANPMYSPALGGVKVQVRENDVKLVIPIMRELGYEIDDEGYYATQVKKLIRFTHKIPIINKYPLEDRYGILLLLAAIVLGVIVSLVRWVVV